jgi:hypothetical protein
LVGAFVGSFDDLLVGDFVGALTGGGLGGGGPYPFTGALVGGCTGAFTGTLTTGVGTGTLTTGVGTNAFTTTGFACTKNAPFLLEEVGAAYSCERFRPCKIRVTVLYTLINDSDVVIHAPTEGATRDEEKALAQVQTLYSHEMEI